MFTLHYDAPTYNPNRSYWQSQNRYARHEVFTTPEEAKARIPELEEKGCHSFEICNSIGKTIFSK